MYSFLHQILSDKKGEKVFSCFGGWHFIYILLAVVAAAVLLWRLKSRSREEKLQTARTVGTAAFGLYLLDFFLMPLAYGEIDIEKLPFHACTAMCVMCFLSHRIPRLERHRPSFALLGFLSNFVYLIYPAGVMWHRVGPLSYRVVQTLLFHGIMTVYGVLMLACEGEKLRFRTCRRELITLSAMTLWAVLGNGMYNGESEGYSHFFNWFFVVRDPFYLLPEGAAPFVMPFVNIAVFFAAEMLVYLVLHWLRSREKTAGGR